MNTQGNETAGGYSVAYRINKEQCSSSVKEDDLDPDSPYWVPSDEERELMNQLNKLKIQSVPPKDWSKGVVNAYEEIPYNANFNDYPLKEGVANL